MMRLAPTLFSTVLLALPAAAAIPSIDGEAALLAAEFNARPASPQFWDAVASIVAAASIAEAPAEEAFKFVRLFRPGINLHAEHSAILASAAFAAKKSNDDLMRLYAQLKPYDVSARTAAVISAAAAQDPQVAAILAVFNKIHDARGLPFEVEAKLAAGSIQSGRSPDEMLGLYDEVKRFASAIKPTADGMATLAAGAANSRKHPGVLLGLFLEILSSGHGPDFDGAAELAAAAAMSNKSAEEVVQLFNLYRAIDGPALGNDGSAIFAAAAAVSGKPPVAFFSLLKANPKLPRPITKSNSFRLIAGAVISEEPVSNHFDLYSKILASQEGWDFKLGAAVLTNAALIAASERRKAPDYSRQLTNPVLPANDGDNTAEKNFQLNWHGSHR